MTEEDVASRAARLAARPGRGSGRRRHPAETSRIVAAGASTTALFALIAALSLTNPAPTAGARVATVAPSATTAPPVVVTVPTTTAAPPSTIAPAAPARTAAPVPPRAVAAPQPAAAVPAPAPTPHPVPVTTTKSS